MKNKVVLVPFPFDDLSSSKVRPAVCLTDEIGTHRHLVFAFITSKISADRLDTDVVIEWTDSGFEASGLKTASTIRLHRLMTASSDLVHLEWER